MGSLGAVGVVRLQFAGPCLSETVGVTFRGTCIMWYPAMLCAVVRFLQSH